MTAETDPHRPIRDKEAVPRVLIRAMFGLVLVILAMVTWARVTDRPLEAMAVDGEIVAERQIHIFGALSGAATVTDLQGSVITTLGPQEGGFVAGVMRAVAHVRKTAGVAEEAPLRLMRFKDGRLALRDELTGYRVELMGFGKDNVAAFGRLLN